MHFPKQTDFLYSILQYVICLFLFQIIWITLLATVILIDTHLGINGPLYG